MNPIVIKTVPMHIIAEMLKKTKNGIVQNLKLENIIDDGGLTRTLLEEFSTDTINYKKHILLDHDARGLLIVESSHVDSMIKEVIEKYKDGILKILAEYEHFRNTPEHIDSAQCFERLTGYIQRKLLGNIAHRWYLDLSDYIIDGFYTHFGEDAIRALPEQYNQDENTLQSLNMDVRAFDHVISDKVYHMDHYFSVKQLISTMKALEVRTIEGSIESEKIRVDDGRYMEFIEDTYDVADIILTNKNKIFARYPEKLINIAEKLTLNEKTRLGLKNDDGYEESDRMLKESERLGLKLRKHVYKYILKALEKIYLGREFYVHFEYFEPNEFQFHAIQEIKIEEHGIELWNTDTSTYIDLEAHEKNEHQEDDTDISEITRRLVGKMSKVETSFKGDYKDETELNEPVDTSPFLDFLENMHDVVTFVLGCPEEYSKELIKIASAFNHNETTRMKNSTLTHDENEKMLDESERLGYELRKLVYAYLGVTQATRPTLETIKANFAENGFHYRVGDIVEMETEGIEGEHFAFVSRFFGETYVVGKLDVSVGCYYLIPLKRYREASHMHTSLFVRSVESNGRRVEFADYDLAVKGQSETETTDVTESDRDMKVEVRVYLAQLFSSIGINRPSNHDEIFDFIVNDVSETADPINYHSGDMAIAFRRFIERGADG